MSVDLRVQMPDPDPWEAFLYRKQKDTGEPTPVYLGAWPPDEYYLKVALWWEGDSGTPPRWKWELSPYMHPHAVRGIFKDTYIIASVYHGIMMLLDGIETEENFYNKISELLKKYNNYTLKTYTYEELLPKYNIQAFACNNFGVNDLEKAATKLIFAMQDDAVAHKYLLAGEIDKEDVIEQEKKEDVIKQYKNLL